MAVLEGLEKQVLPVNSQNFTAASAGTIGGATTAGTAAIGGVTVPVANIAAGAQGTLTFNINQALRGDNIGQTTPSSLLNTIVTTPTTSQPFHGNALQWVDVLLAAQVGVVTGLSISAVSIDYENGVAPAALSLIPVTAITTVISAVGVVQRVRVPINPLGRFSVAGSFLQVLLSLTTNVPAGATLVFYGLVLGFNYK